MNHRVRNRVKEDETRRTYLLNTFYRLVKTKNFVFAEIHIMFLRWQCQNLKINTKGKIPPTLNRIVVTRSTISNRMRKNVKNFLFHLDGFINSQTYRVWKVMFDQVTISFLISYKLCCV